MSGSAGTSTPPLGPEPGALARVFGVFMSPAKTFESIARKPGWDWLVPVVLLMVASFIAQSAMLPKMDVDEAVKTQMKFIDKMAKGSIPAEKRAEIEQKTREVLQWIPETSVTFQGRFSTSRRIAAASACDPFCLRVRARPTRASAR
jgi:hypothetical protein